MLTRVEISGFKTFDGFELDVPPFLAVIGPNASGKSNLFDALQFLRRITETNLTVAVSEARGSVEDLFRRRGNGRSVDEIAVAVEVLLPPRVRDPWGTEVDLTQTRLRYAMVIEKRQDAEGNIRIFVKHEEVRPIARSKDRWRSLQSPSKSFDDAFVRDGKRRQSFLETVHENHGRRSFRTRQDGVQGRARPAEAAEATVLSSMTSAEFKHLYALRQEIVSWRFLQLDPMSLRSPGEKFGEERLEPSGANLARVLHRIQAETSTPEDPAGSLAEISADLATLIDGVRSVEVRENPQTRKWEIVLNSDGEGEYTSVVASDGTLRILALLTSLYDPAHSGLVCFEEPENGVHPLRLRTLIRYLHDLVTDVSAEGADVSDGLSQVVLNSHSPVVLSSVSGSGAVVLDSSVRVEGNGDDRVYSRVSRARHVSRDITSTLNIKELHAVVNPQEVRRYEAAALLEEMR